MERNQKYLKGTKSIQKKPKLRKGIKCIQREPKVSKMKKNYVKRTNSI